MLEAKFVKNTVYPEGFALQLSFDKGRERLFPNGRVSISGTIKDGLVLEKAISPGEGYKFQNGGKRSSISVRPGFAGVPPRFPTHSSGPIEGTAGPGGESRVTLNPFDMSTLPERAPRQRVNGNGKANGKSRRRTSDVDALRSGIEDINTLAENMGAVLLLDDQGKLGATIKL